MMSDYTQMSMKAIGQGCRGKSPHKRRSAGFKSHPSVFYPTSLEVIMGMRKAIS